MKLLSQERPTTNITTFINVDEIFLLLTITSKSISILKS